MPVNDWARRTRILFELSYVSEPEALQTLQEHGLSEKEARTLMKTTWSQLGPEIASEWKAQAENVVGNLKEGTITPREAYDMLLHIGYGSVESGVVLEYLQAE